MNENISAKEIAVYLGITSAAVRFRIRRLGINYVAKDVNSMMFSFDDYKKIKSYTRRNASPNGIKTTYHIYPSKINYIENL